MLELMSKFKTNAQSVVMEANFNAAEFRSNHDAWLQEIDLSIDWHILAFMENVLSCKW